MNDQRSTTNDQRSKVRIPLAEGRALANEVLDLYAGTTDRIEILGSIRREKPTVGDAEIVFIPTFANRPVGMFDDTQAVNLQLERTLQLIAAGKLTKRVHKNGATTCGAGAQYLEYKGFNIDLFGVIAPSQYGVIKVIRTGPHEFNTKKLVFSRADGGILQTGQRIKDGQLWDLGKALVTPDEDDFFKQIDHPFIPPNKRGEFALSSGNRATQQTSNRAT
jgi:DNA polymerase/3'-5' exonuclease PolX